MLREEIDDDAIVVAAAGSLPADLERLWVTDAKDSYNMEYGASCMGYEIAGALGAKLAEPDKEVYALVGDGSFMMLNSEIPTAIQENAKITIVVFDNCAFGCINNLQMGNGISSLATRDASPQRSDRQAGRQVLLHRFRQGRRRLRHEGVLRQDPMSSARRYRTRRRRPAPASSTRRFCPKTMAEGYESWWHIGVASTSKSDAVKEARKRIDDHPRRGENVLRQSQQRLIPFSSSTVLTSHCILRNYFLSRRPRCSACMAVRAAQGR